MFVELLVKISFRFLLCVLLICALMTEAVARVDSSTGKTKSPSSPEIMTLRLLGLGEDANDKDIVKFLDIPDKRIFAISLVERRRIYPAIPKLLQIVDDNKTTISAKLSAAEALCTLGNIEWMPTIKALSEDPNSMIARTSYKYDVAGLMARAGDYSQFEIVKNGLTDSKDYIRSKAIHQLGNFGHKTDPVTNSAVKLLRTAAMSDPVPFLRELAIESLEKIAKRRPDINPKIIEALEANIDSADKDLRLTCRAKLKGYGRELKTD